MITSSRSTPINPRIEMIVSITVQDKNVCLSDRLKNSLNIQKPESLICDPNTLPEPTANTINSGDTTPVATNGDTTPAAVMAATVADPIVTRNSAVMTQANINGGICHLLLNDAIYAPVPLSVNTCLKTPPAVMMSKIIAIPEMAALSHFIIVSIE